MNDSGRSVAAALRALKLPLERVLVVHDHIDLTFGRLRLMEGGGSGGHNGLKSITGLLGPDYVRLRVGVDRPASYDPDVVADYVLSRFGESKAAVAELVGASADAVELWLYDGLEEAANRVNGLETLRAGAGAASGRRGSAASPKAGRMPAFPRCRPAPRWRRTSSQSFR